MKPEYFAIKKLFLRNYNLAKVNIVIKSTKLKIDVAVAGQVVIYNITYYVRRSSATTGARSCVKGESRWPVGLCHAMARSEGLNAWEGNLWTLGSNNLYICAHV